MRSSVGLLETSSGSLTSKSLGFTTSRVGNKKSLVVLEEELLKFSLFWLILEFLVEADNSFADSLTNSHYLSSGTTTSYSNTDVQVGESVGTEEENRLVNFHAHGSGFNEFDSLSIDSDETFAISDIGNGSCVFLSAETLGLILLAFTLFSHFFLWYVCIRKTSCLFYDLTPKYIIIIIHRSTPFILFLLYLSRHSI